MAESEAVLFRRTDGAIWVLESSEGSKSWREILRPAQVQAFKPEDLQEYRIYQSRDISRLNYLASVLKDDLSYGWITRDGHFWGNGCGGHYTMAERVLGVCYAEAEMKLGWIHVSDRWTIFTRNMTPEQERALSQIGRYSENTKYRDREVRFEDAFPGGYPLHLIPDISLYKPPQPRPVRLITPSP